MLRSHLDQLYRRLTSRLAGTCRVKTTNNPKRLCRLEPLEDRCLLSFTSFQSPEPLIYGPSQTPVHLGILLPAVERSPVIDWTDVEESVTGTASETAVSLDNAATGSDGVTDYYAVIVGISDYPGTGDDLECPALDAQDMRDTLLTGTNWRPENMLLLQDSQATHAAVVAAIQQMGTMADADDVCLFYYSGHGAQVTDQAPYDETDGYDEVLVTCDFATVGVLTDDLLMNTLDGLPTDQFLMILDCCQSSGESSTVEDTIANGVAEDLFATTSTATTTGSITPMDYDPGQGLVLTACAEGELSYEGESMGNSTFTYNFLEGLRGWADVNDDGWVSAEECFDFAKYRAVIHSPDAHPTLFDYHLGELPLVQLASEIPEVIYYEDFAAMPTGWIIADNDADGNTWDWADDETMFIMVNPWLTTLYPNDGLGSDQIDCSGYDNLFLRVDQKVTNYTYLELDLDLIDSAEQRTTVWSKAALFEDDFNSLTLDVSTIAAGDSAVSMEWWFTGEIYPGEMGMWELIDVELRASDTKDIRVSVLDQGVEGGSQVRARVDVLAAPLTDLVITLESEDESEVTTPVTVTLPAGQTTAEFYLTMANDSLCDGTQNVTITASVAGYQAGADTIEILDDEPDPIPGDANLDGYVDGSDATILATYWQNTNATWTQGDFNRDGKVDGSDATLLASYWQASIYDA